MADVQLERRDGSLTRRWAWDGLDRLRMPEIAARISDIMQYVLDESEGKDVKFMLMLEGAMDKGE